MKSIVVIILVSVVLLQIGCNDLGPTNPDPCAGYSYEPLKINIYEDLFGERTMLYDTALTGDRISFEATKKADRYRWYIGDSLRNDTGAVLYLRFMKSYGVATIRLITFTSRDTACGDRDGYDTASVDLMIFPRTFMGYQPTLGTYVGVSSERPDTITTIRIARIGAGKYYDHITVKNLPIGSNFPSDTSLYSPPPCLYGWRSLFYSYNTLNGHFEDGLKNVKAMARLSRRGDSIVVDYSFQPHTIPYPKIDDASRVQHIFRGVRQ